MIWSMVFLFRNAIEPDRWDMGGHFSCWWYWSVDQLTENDTCTICFIFSMSCCFRILVNHRNWRCAFSFICTNCQQHFGFLSASGFGIHTHFGQSAYVNRCWPILFRTYSRYIYSAHAHALKLKLYNLTWHVSFLYTANSNYSKSKLFRKVIFSGNWIASSLVCYCMNDCLSASAETFTAALLFVLFFFFVLFFIC